MSTTLPQGRLEERFTPKKPLYDAAEAVAEANRCLYCSDAPCVKACPTSIEIPEFIRKIATGNVKGAARTILEANLLGQSCGQACPVEVLCAGKCVYQAWGREPLAIGRLQHYAVDAALAQQPKLFTAKPPTGKKVALVGAGPASVAAAGWLALEGHRCTLFERKAVPGGLNSLGIAPYKMKANEALRELDWVLSLGAVELKTGVEVVEKPTGPGQLAASELLGSYDAVFLGLGLGADSALSVPGAEGPGVWGATELIERIKADPTLALAPGRAAVVGGGNTAIDIAHELALLGWSVALVYRRSEQEMGGYAHELEAARKHGVRFIPQRAPTKVVRMGGQVVGLEVAPAAKGQAVDGPREVLPVELVAVAIGQAKLGALARAFPGVQLDRDGCVVVDPTTQRTGHAKVWAGGDCVNGGKEIVNAAAEAKVAVRHIHATLMGVK